MQVETRSLGLKKALQGANRQGFRLALILGDGELEQGIVTARNLAEGTQESWPLAELADRLNA